MATIDDHGLISRGQKLGVHIGDPLPVAVRTLEGKGLEMAGTQRGGSCPIPATFEADYTAYLIDLSWRRGTICLGVTQGRVSHIGWLYNLLAP